jgi:Recombination endonuclease VII
MTADPYDRSPACWSWEPPTDADRERVRARWAPILKGRLTDEVLDSFVMIDWHQGRCAACGLAGHGRVEDHDHETGLIRGSLCRSCNTREGMNRYAGGLWREYRERPPSVICGVEDRYWDPIAKDFAQPR